MLLLSHFVALNARCSTVFSASGRSQQTALSLKLHHAHGNPCVADGSKGVKYREIFVFGSYKFLYYTVQTKHRVSLFKLHESQSNNKNPMVTLYLLGVLILVITNKDSMICLVLKKLYINEQLFKFK